MFTVFSGRDIGGASSSINLVLLSERFKCAQTISTNI